MKSLFCLLILSVAAHATIIFVDSEASNTLNDSGQPTVDLTGLLHPNSAWAGAFDGSDWISYGSTGASGDPGYFAPANGITVTFTTQFVLSGAINGAYLDVMADDSTSVVLNGHTLIAAVTTPGTTCSADPVGCLTSTEGIFTFAELGPYLFDGTNTLAFGVVQVGAYSFGVDFAGGIDDAASTPEPATVAIIGGGLVVLASLRRRK